LRSQFLRSFAYDCRDLIEDENAHEEEERITALEERADALEKAQKDAALDAEMRRQHEQLERDHEKFMQKYFPNLIQ
jgi:molecular chaperone GrpE (heat shock protein)